MFHILADMGEMSFGECWLNACAKHVNQISAKEKLNSGSELSCQISTRLYVSLYYVY